MRSFLAVLFVLAATIATAHALDPTEQRIVEFVDASNDEALALLERVVNVNSGTMNFEGVREVADIFAPAFEALGFRTEWIDGAAFDRAGHLIAERGDRGPHLLLIGHLDTVFEPDSPFQTFERIDATHARAPGAIDMKGGIVVLLYALRALEQVGALDDLTVTVFLAGDEERAGRPTSLSRARLLEAAATADIALGFEDGDGDPTTAVVSRRGSTSWTLEITGRPAHSSLVFRHGVGAGAIFEASRIVEGWRVALADEADLTFSPGRILGGTTVEHDATNSRGTAFGKTNVVPETAIVAGDLRVLSRAQLERVQRTMQEIASANLPHTSATLTFHDGYPPLDRTAGNLELLARYDAVSRDLGFGPVAPVDPMKAGAADISFTSGRIERALDGLGLMGTGGHTVDETADLSTLPMQTQRAAVLMLRLALRSPRRTG